MRGYNFNKFKSISSAICRIISGSIHNPPGSGTPGFAVELGHSGIDSNSLSHRSDKNIYSNKNIIDCLCVCTDLLHYQLGEIPQYEEMWLKLKIRGDYTLKFAIKCTHAALTQSACVEHALLTSSHCHAVLMKKLKDN